MARYFFDIYDAQITVRDDEGVECAGRDSVSSEALRALCQIAEDHPDRFVGGKLLATVRGTNDRTVLTASISLTAAWHVEGETSEAA